MIKIKSKLFYDNLSAYEVVEGRETLKDASCWGFNDVLIVLAVAKEEESAKKFHHQVEVIVFVITPSIVIRDVHSQAE